MIHFLADNFIDNTFIWYAVTFIVVYVMYAMVRMYKSNKMCDEHFGKESKGFNVSIMNRALVVSLTTNLLITFFNFITPYAQFIPFIGIIFRGWDWVGTIPGLQHAILLMFAHFIENLRENVPKTLKDVCVDNKYEVNILDILPSY